MALTIRFVKSQPAAFDTLVLGVHEGQALTKPAQFIDDENNGFIKAALKNKESFTGKEGQSTSLSHPSEAGKQIILIGLGEKGSCLNSTALENIGGKLKIALKNSDAKKVALDLSLAPKAIASIAYGVRLKSYNFDKFKSKPEKEKKLDLAFVTPKGPEAKALYNTHDAVAEGVFLARDLVNEPPNSLHPESYAARIKEELKPLGVDVEVLDEKKMAKQGFGALLSVGQGSARESQTVIMRWNGDKKAKKSAQAPIAFVGKGVTFDTGGISLKPGAEMDLMKMDMGGSAAVVGLMKALASRNAKANVIGIVGLVENMPSSNAYRPGDVITSHSGKTIEVLNTDAEGRLVLADALTYVQQKYKPATIIDLATLTGAIMVALGYEYCGVFANDDKLWKSLEKASGETGEKFWRMPLDEAYRTEMESEIADLKNLGSLGRYGGACSAAGFLEHFIDEGVNWSHIDIAGTAWWKIDKDVTPKGGTGFPVRALDRFVRDTHEK